MNTHSDFASRHIGPQGEERREMLDSLGYRTLDELIADIVPAEIGRASCRERVFYSV